MIWVMNGASRIPAKPYGIKVIVNKPVCATDRVMMRTEVHVTSSSDTEKAAHEIVPFE